LHPPLLLEARAHVVLSHSDARLTQTSDTAWTLGKTGAVDAAASTVTWTITATEGSTVGGHLVVTGFMAVTNCGTGGATIGNIVVNLQTMSNGKWVTQSSDIADATHGDAATTAHVDPDKSSQHIATFTENAASGRLQFMDAKTNTVFSLVPEVTVAPGATIGLLFSAAFDNYVLALAAGTPTRTEVLVSFGDAAPKAPSAPNIDINGNGVIDADEAWVRTVSTLIEKHVPAPQAANTSVTLSDAVADIAATGTVTFTNPVITLGVTTGAGEVTIGLSSPGFSMSFSDATYVLAYLPALGAIGPLNTNLSNPTSSASGAFGGEVLALELNVDFSDAGFLLGTSHIPFGNLTLCNFSTLTALNGSTVRQFLATANTLLGGGTSTYGIADLAPVALSLNGSFFFGAASTFAQQNLVNGACP